MQSSKESCPETSSAFRVIHEHKEPMPTGKEKFVDYIEKNKDRCPGPTGIKEITTRELAFRVGIGYEMFRKIINQQKPTEKRDCIVAICIALGMNSEKTSNALRLYHYMSGLDEKNPRDCLIIEALDNESEHYTIEEISSRLQRCGFPPLDVINHRSVTKKVGGSKLEHFDSPYRILEKRISTSINEILFDQYASLSTA